MSIIYRAIVVLIGLLTALISHSCESNVFAVEDWLTDYTVDTVDLVLVDASQELSLCNASAWDLHRWSFPLNFSLLQEDLHKQRFVGDLCSQNSSLPQLIEVRTGCLLQSHETGYTDTDWYLLYCDESTLSSGSWLCSVGRESWKGSTTRERHYEEDEDSLSPILSPSSACLPLRFSEVGLMADTVSLWSVHERVVKLSVGSKLARRSDEPSHHGKSSFERQMENALNTLSEVLPDNTEATGFIVLEVSAFSPNSSMKAVSNGKNTSTNLLSVFFGGVLSPAAVNITDSITEYASEQDASQTMEKLDQYADCYTGVLAVVSLQNSADQKKDQQEANWFIRNQLLLKNDTAANVVDDQQVEFFSVLPSASVDELKAFFCHFKGDNQEKESYSISSLCGVSATEITSTELSIEIDAITIAFSSADVLASNQNSTTEEGTKATKLSTTIGSSIDVTFSMGNDDVQLSLLSHNTIVQNYLEKAWLSSGQPLIRMCQEPSCLFMVDLFQGETLFSDNIDDMLYPLLACAIVCSGGEDCFLRKNWSIECSCRHSGCVSLNITQNSLLWETESMQIAAEEKQTDLRTLPGYSFASQVLLQGAPTTIVDGVHKWYNDTKTNVSVPSLSMYYNTRSPSFDDQTTLCFSTVERNSSSCSVSSSMEPDIVLGMWSSCYGVSSFITKAQLFAPLTTSFAVDIQVRKRTEDSNRTGSNESGQEGSLSSVSSTVDSLQESGSAESGHEQTSGESSLFSLIVFSSLIDSLDTSAFAHQSSSFASLSTSSGKDYLASLPSTFSQSSSISVASLDSGWVSTSILLSESEFSEHSSRREEMAASTIVFLSSEGAASGESSVQESFITSDSDESDRSWDNSLPLFSVSLSETPLSRPFFSSSGKSDRADWSFFSFSSISTSEADDQSDLTSRSCDVSGNSDCLRSALSESLVSSAFQSSSSIESLLSRPISPSSPPLPGPSMSSFASSISLSTIYSLPAPSSSLLFVSFPEMSSGDNNNNNNEESFMSSAFLDLSFSVDSSSEDSEILEFSSQERISSRLYFLSESSDVQPCSRWTESLTSLSSFDEFFSASPSLSTERTSSEKESRLSSADGVFNSSEETSLSFNEGGPLVSFSRSSSSFLNSEGLSSSSAYSSVMLSTDESRPAGASSEVRTIDGSSFSFVSASSTLDPSSLSATLPSTSASSAGSETKSDSSFSLLSERKGSSGEEEDEEGRLEREEGEEGRDDDEEEQDNPFVYYVPSKSLCKKENVARPSILASINATLLSSSFSLSDVQLSSQCSSIELAIAYFLGLNSSLAALDETSVVQTSKAVLFGEEKMLLNVGNNLLSKGSSAVAISSSSIRREFEGVDVVKISFDGQYVAVDMIVLFLETNGRNKQILKGRLSKIPKSFLFNRTNLLFDVLAIAGEEMIMIEESEHDETEEISRDFVLLPLAPSIGIGISSAVAVSVAIVVAVKVVKKRKVQRKRSSLFSSSPFQRQRKKDRFNNTSRQQKLRSLLQTVTPLLRRQQSAGGKQNDAKNDKETSNSIEDDALPSPIARGADFPSSKEDEATMETSQLWRRFRLLNEGSKGSGVGLRNGRFRDREIIDLSTGNSDQRSSLFSASSVNEVTKTVQPESKSAAVPQSTMKEKKDKRVLVRVLTTSESRAPLEEALANDNFASLFSGVFDVHVIELEDFGVEEVNVCGRLRREIVELLLLCNKNSEREARRCTNLEDQTSFGHKQVSSSEEAETTPKELRLMIEDYVCLRALKQKRSSVSFSSSQQSLFRKRMTAFQRLNAENRPKSGDPAKANSNDEAELFESVLYAFSSSAYLGFIAKAFDPFASLRKRWSIVTDRDRERRTVDKAEEALLGREKGEEREDFTAVDPTGAVALLRRAFEATSLVQRAFEMSVPCEPSLLSGRPRQVQLRFCLWPIFTGKRASTAFFSSYFRSLPPRLRSEYSTNNSDAAVAFLQRLSSSVKSKTSESTRRLSGEAFLLRSLRCLALEVTTRVSTFVLCDQRRSRTVREVSSIEECFAELCDRLDKQALKSNEDSEAAASSDSVTPREYTTFTTVLQLLLAKQQRIEEIERESESRETNREGDGKGKGRRRIRRRKKNHRNLREERLDEKEHSHQEGPETASLSPKMSAGNDDRDTRSRADEGGEQPFSKPRRRQLRRRNLVDRGKAADEDGKLQSREVRKRSEEAALPPLRIERRPTKQQLLQEYKRQ